jgi:hypothetical protein
MLSFHGCREGFLCRGDFRKEIFQNIWSNHEEFDMLDAPLARGARLRSHPPTRLAVRSCKPFVPRSVSSDSSAKRDNDTKLDAWARHETRDSRCLAAFFIFPHTFRDTSLELALKPVLLISDGLIGTIRVVWPRAYEKNFGR